MHKMITVDTLKYAIAVIADKMDACFDELNSVDSKIGDGDIGITMTVGFKALKAITNELPDDVGMALFQCAKAFTGARASSFGTLFATGLMAAAKIAKGSTQVEWNILPAMLQQVVEKMAQRGKSELGEKTVLDIIDAIRWSLEELTDPVVMLDAADKTAKQTIKEFKPRQCLQGRARIFGKKTIGIDDPGMVVIQKLIEALKENT